MLFETLIQVVLQVRMLIFFKRHNIENPGAVGVSVDDILLSLVLALLHAVLEGVSLGLEAQASKMSFVNYCMVCLNGRFGWVPYNEFLVKKSQEATQLSEKIQLDFQKIKSKLLCMEIEVEFTFSNDSLLSLSKTLSTFPKALNKKVMP